MLALIFTRKLRPMIIGSISGWLMFAGMIARPRATSSRTNSGRQPLADRDELHLRRDLALARVVHLRDVAAPAQDLPGPRHAEPGRARAAPASSGRTRPAPGSTAGAAPAGLGRGRSRPPDPCRAPTCRTRASGRSTPPRRASPASAGGRSRGTEPASRAVRRRTPCANPAAARGWRRRWTEAPRDECSSRSPYGGITRIRFAGSPGDIAPDSQPFAPRREVGSPVQPD